MSHKKAIPSKEELLAHYNEYGATISTLAKIYNTSNPTIRKWLIFYGIERKTHKQASTEANNRNRTLLPTREELLSFYENNSLYDTYAHFSVGQKKLYEWLEYYNIPQRDLSEGCSLGKNKQYSDIQFDKTTVEKVYGKHHHMGLTSQELGISYSHLKTLMAKYSIQAIIPWRSKGENDLLESITSLNPNIEWISNDKSIINPYEIDILSKSNKLAVEYCGLYWHSETFGSKSKTYHQEKYQMCKDKGYNLITVFESDDQKKILNLIKTKIGLTTRIYARKCEIYQIDSSIASDFHKIHHLHKSVGGNTHYGLYYGDELIMVLSMGKPRFSSNYEWECTRMTSHSDYSVIGGASKLFAYFFKTHKVKSCVTFSDLRFGEGNVYGHCGLRFIKNTKPNYWYFHKDKPTELYSRVKFQKHKLKKLLPIFDESKTEYENMVMNKWDRIWDCGNSMWEYRA